MINNYVSFLFHRYFNPSAATDLYMVRDSNIQLDTKEMIVAAYGMGNVPSGTDLNSLCQASYTRDIRA